jgi:hypothetical protein
MGLPSWNVISANLAYARRRITLLVVSGKRGIPSACDALTNVSTNQNGR